MIKIEIIYKRNILDNIEVKENTNVLEILNNYKNKFTYPIYACKVNNLYRGLNHRLAHDSVLEFLDINNQATWLIYQNSLVLLYIKAVHDVLGKEVKVSINNSLNKGLYTDIKVDINKEIVKEIEKRMHQLVALDLPIKKEYMSKEMAIKLCKEHKLYDTYDLLMSINNIKEVEIYSLDDEIDIFYGLTVPSTHFLNLFELHYYKKAVLLRYPHPNDPLSIPEYVDQNLLYGAFKEATLWGKLMGINYCIDLNKKILNKETEDIFLMQEALHEKKIAYIADEIAKKKKHVVLICGPSSSGKTTFAKRLVVQLNVLGIKPLYLGTDDYFVELDEKPRDENGELDLESIKAVDTNLFIQNLKDLLDGKEVDLPIYDFTTNKKIFGKRISKLSKDRVIVIEGIHTLNPLLTEGINENDKFKIYISPLTPVGIDSHNRIPTTDARMLRRIVRDHQFRNRDIKQILNEWTKVRIGEEKNIFPLNDEADVFFNSNCLYELSVLKKYAEPLLKEIKREDKEYAEAQRMLNLLRFVDVISDDDKIVNNSIIREFIGGSVLVK